MRTKWQMVSNSRSIGVFAIIFVVGYWFSVSSLPSHGHDGLDHAAHGDEEFKAAPDSVLHKLGGGTVKLSDYHGKWVFLNFWATWCPPCIKEMPSMDAFYKKFKDKNLTILAVSVDGAGEKVVRPFVEKHGFSFDIFLDQDQEASKAFEVFGIPATYVINPEGEVVAQATGPREWMDPIIIDYFMDLMSIKKEKL